MILAFPDVQKAPSDIKTVALDWTNLLNSIDSASTVTAHTAWTEVPNEGSSLYDNIAPGDAGVISADAGMTGFVQAVQLSGGDEQLYSVVTAQITFANGDQLARSFKVVVR